MTTSICDWSTLSPSFTIAVCSASLAFFSFFLQSVIIPNYSTSSTFGDLAILELSSASPSTPVALPTASSSLSGVPKVTVMGWGVTEQNTSPYVLRYTEMATISQSQCRAAHSSYIGGSPPEDHLCFGLESNRHSSCSGDSGGPYVTPGNPIQVAVVSYGPGGARFLVLSTVL